VIIVDNITYDGEPAVIYSDHLFVRATWMAREFPETGQELHVRTANQKPASTPWKSIPLEKPGNPGMTAAREAAAAVGGVLAVPDFGPDRPGPPAAAALPADPHPEP